MKKIVVALDSFKGSLDSLTAGMAVREGIKQVYENAVIDVFPIADGGEGFVEAISYSTGAKTIKASVMGPLGEPVYAQYAILEKTNTAVIEMSSAAGITLVPKEKLNPLETTTYGVGQMICDAINRGVRNFVVGLGGSATNDGGVGMLCALGFEFLDKYGNPVSHGAKGLKDLAQIKAANVLKELKECNFSVACDVKNVLCGNDGCSAVFGSQKGATAQMIKDMDAWLLNYAHLTKELNPKSNENKEGCGAAGGMGFAFVSYLGATLEPGINLVMETIGIEEYIKNADIVITGEGRLDGQSYMGKVPFGIASLSKKYGKPVIAFCGSATDDASRCNEYGIDAYFTILKKPCTLKEAMEKDTAYNNLKDTAHQVLRFVKMQNNS